MSAGRTLLLLRHAHAAPHVPTEAGDRGRPLTEAGRHEARAVGAKLAAFGFTPPLLTLASPAARTVETAREALSALPAAPVPVLEESIYHASPEALLALARETDDSVRTLMLVGHNPAIGALARDLAEGAASHDHAPKDALALLRAGFAPATLAVFTFEDSWAKLRPAHGALRAVLLP